MIEYLYNLRKRKKRKKKISSKSDSNYLVDREMNRADKPDTTPMYIILFFFYCEHCFVLVSA